MTKGIILIATGHSYYGRMAYNLALSIKAKDKNLPIAIVYNESAFSNLSGLQRKLFDYMIPSDSDWRSIKFSLPELTPFDLNLFIDVDTVWMKNNPAEVFDILESTDFTCVNEGYYDAQSKKDLTTKIYGWGCNMDDMIKSYRIAKGKLWKTRGEFMLFKKSKKISALFKKAEGYCNEPKITLKVFAGGNPTEFAFDVALNKMGMDCHIEKWQPAYWANIYKTPIPILSELNKKYYAFSVGGSRINETQKKIYNLVMEAACYQFGLKHIFKLQSKSQIIPERTKK